MFLGPHAGGPRVRHRGRFLGLPRRNACVCAAFRGTSRQRNVGRREAQHRANAGALPLARALAARAPRAVRPRVPDWGACMLQAVRLSATLAACMLALDRADPARAGYFVGFIGSPAGGTFL